MKVYFYTENHTVIITDGETAKIYDGSKEYHNGANGYYEGVALYAPDTVEHLRKKFQMLENAGEMNGYNEIYSPDEFPYY